MFAHSYSWAITNVLYIELTW